MSAADPGQTQAPPAPLDLAVLPAPAPRAVGGGPAPTLREALQPPAAAPPVLDRLAFVLHGVLEAAVARRIERRLMRLRGVEEARVDDAYERLTLSVLDRPLDPQLVVALLADDGVTAAPVAEDDHGSARRRVARRGAALRRVALRTTVLVALGLVAGGVHDAWAAFNEQVRAIALNGQLILTGAVVLWGARPAITGAFAAAFAGRLAAELLPVLVGIGLFAGGVAVFVSGGQARFEAPLLVLGGVVWGQSLGWALQAAARRPLLALRASLGATVEVLQVGGLFRLAPQGLAVGDTLIVREGGLLPADGVVAEGAASLSGGPLAEVGPPRQVLPGDAVWGGQRVERGAAAVRVLRPSHQSALAVIASRLEGAGADDPWLAARGRRAAALVAGASVAVAAAVFAVRMGADASPGGLDHGALRAALAVLVAAAPGAAARLLDPTLVAAVARGLARGLRFRDAQAVYALSRVREMHCDRTGVLAHAAPTLAGWCLAPGVDRGEVLATVAALEAGSRHPVGAALATLAAEAASSAGAPSVSLVSLETVPGQGKVGRRRDGVAARLGSARLIEGAGVALAPGACEVAGHGEVGPAGVDGAACADTLAYLALDARVVARFHLRYPVRAAARPALGGLRGHGAIPGVFTGDHAAAARRVSEITSAVVSTSGADDDALAAWLAARERRRPGRVAVVAGPDRATKVRRAASVSVLFDAGLEARDLRDDLTVTGPALGSLADAVALARRARRKATAMAAAVALYAAATWGLAAADALGLEVAALGSLAVTAAVSLAGALGRPLPARPPN